MLVNVKMIEMTSQIKDDRLYCPKYPDMNYSLTHCKKDCEVLCNS